jgi:hypothetical protein
VYEACDDRLGRQVALKMIRGALQDPKSRERFWREARAAGALSHPNICHIYHVRRLDRTIPTSIENTFWLKGDYARALELLPTSPAPALAASSLPRWAVKTKPSRRSRKTRPEARTSSPTSAGPSVLRFSSAATRHARSNATSRSEGIPWL